MDGFLSQTKYFYPKQWLKEVTRKTRRLRDQGRTETISANARLPKQFRWVNPEGKIRSKYAWGLENKKTEKEGNVKRGPRSKSCLEGRSQIETHYSPSLGTLQRCRTAFMLSVHWEKTSLKNCFWDFNLKIIFFFQLTKGGWFLPYHYTTDKKETHSEFYGWKRSLMFQTKLNNGFYKINIFTYIYSEYFFL